jgi:hypothetical protein
MIGEDRSGATLCILEVRLYEALVTFGRGVFIRWLDRGRDSGFRVKQTTEDRNAEA